MNKLVVTSLLFFLNISFSIDCSDSNLGSLATQAGGRVKPLKVLAYETFKFITFEKKPFGKNPVEAFCLLSMKTFGENSDLELPLKVEHIEAKKLLGINEDLKQVPYSLLEDNEMEIRAKALSIKFSTPLKKELNKVMSRMSLYKSLINGQTWTFIKDSPSLEWIKLDSLQKENLDKIINSQERLTNQKLDNTHQLELKFFNQKPFSYAMLFVLIAIFSLVILKGNKIAMSLSFLALAIQVYGMTMRVLISGRAPITNMYETVMFSGFGAALIAFVLTFFKKERIFLISGFAYNLLCLLMMTFANNMLDPAIKPLVPVLRDNFWLSTHVTTIILSYAALAISWILANIIILQKLLKRNVDQKKQSKIMYICIQVGVVLLAAGIILGGVWADYSWGRFWGWDPKETWSLIVLLVYMAILHGRYTSWIKDRYFIPLTAGAFMSVMMAWFGVNYILATGLHSYGFSEGGAIFLGSLFLIQSVIICLSLLGDGFNKAKVA